MQQTNYVNRGKPAIKEKLSQSEMEYLIEKLKNSYERQQENLIFCDDPNDKEEELTEINLQKRIIKKLYFARYNKDYKFEDKK